jgi:hypothetical protein
VADLRFDPDVINVTGRSGDRVQWTIDVTDVNGTPLNWSTYTFRAQIRLNPWDPDPPLGTIVVDATGSATGHLVLTALPATTAALLTPGMGQLQKAWVWDLERTKTGDATDVRTTHTGTITLIMDVTR